jgi:hypothetical protein
MASSIPAPDTPLYRVTLFYGPEAGTRDPSSLSCIFNVKKRSWKGGVQIAVDVSERQMARIREQLGFKAWLENVLRPIHDSDRETYETRAHDLLIQEVCAVKLSLVLEIELRQENGHIEADRFIRELDDLVLHQADRVKRAVLTGLDLAET